jgi:hypothetical protein
MRHRDPEADALAAVVILMALLAYTLWYLAKPKDCDPEAHLQRWLTCVIQ